MPMKNLARCWAILLFAILSIAAAASDLRLVEAVKNQDKSAVRALLKQGLDVNARQGDGATALHWAAHWDDVETADLLLRAGAKVDAADDDGATPLWVACTTGNAATIARLLEAGANPNVALELGETPLMTASRTGNSVGVRLLLAHGADVNARERTGQTALMWAVAQRHPKVVEALIESGADIHARSRVWNQVVNIGGEGNNALTSPNPPHPIDMAQGGFTPLLFAARVGDVESAKLLLAAGANPNDSAPAGMSALVLASHSAQGAFAAFLLDNGADPNAVGAGYAALHAAILRSDVELVKALLAHGANANTRLAAATPKRRSTPDFALGRPLIGATPFWLAAKFGEFEIMRILAANGADPLFVKDGTTALMAAIGPGERRGFPPLAREEYEGRNVEAVKFLVGLGVDVNAADQAGDTALHSAARLRLNSVVQLLAASGAKLDVENKRGQTPLAVAMAGRPGGLGDTVDAGGGQQSTVELLRKLGAKK